MSVYKKSTQKLSTSTNTLLNPEPNKHIEEQVRLLNIALEQFKNKRSSRPNQKLEDKIDLIENTIHGFNTVKNKAEVIRLEQSLLNKFKKLTTMKKFGLRSKDFFNNSPQAIVTTLALGVDLYAAGAVLASIGVAMPMVIPAILITVGVVLVAIAALKVGFNLLNYIDAKKDSADAKVTPVGALTELKAIFFNKNGKKSPELYVHEFRKNANNFAENHKEVTNDLVSPAERKKANSRNNKHEEFVFFEKPQFNKVVVEDLVTAAEREQENAAHISSTL